MERPRPSRQRPPSSRRQPVTLREVAELAGVHAGTASRALNETSRDMVKAETVERVLAAAKELGYRPNPIARGLKTRRSGTVGVLVPDLMNPLFPPIVRGIQDRLERDSYTPLITNTENDSERERGAFQTMRDRQVDGFVAATASRSHWLDDIRSELGVPLVLVNRRIERGGASSVVGDDRLGIELAVSHLAELGHRRIAFLGGPTGYSTGHLRRAGFIEAVGHKRLPLEESLMLHGESFTIEEGFRICDQLLKEHEPPTAILAGNDLMALGCYDALAKHGLTCPDDISVIGFNDMPFAERFNPPLTSVRIPHYRLGELAADLLLAAITSERREATHLLLEPELVVRSSTAPPR